MGARPLGDLLARGRPNALNLERLFLAAIVIIWHSFSVLGIEHNTEGATSILLGRMPVNGFFVLSGFLIYRSWVHHPNALAFLTARALRIYPGFWVCLAVTAFLFAPLAVVVRGGSAIDQVSDPATFSYLWKNSTLAMFQWTIGSTPVDVPFTSAWNASLWTLAWEFLCYLLLLLLGLSRLLERRCTLPSVVVAFAICVMLSTDPANSNEIVLRLGRFGTYFFVGAWYAKHQDRIRISWIGVLIAFAVVVGAAVMPASTLIQAPAAGYALLGLGGLVSTPVLELRNDISYGMYIYAFPVQQILVVFGLSEPRVILFSAVAFLLTVPLAWLSWLAVERPCLSAKQRILSKIAV